MTHTKYSGHTTLAVLLLGCSTATSPEGATEARSRPSRTAPTETSSPPAAASPAPSSIALGSTARPPTGPRIGSTAPPPSGMPTGSLTLPVPDACIDFKREADGEIWCHGSPPAKTGRCRGLMMHPLLGPICTGGIAP